MTKPPSPSRIALLASPVILVGGGLFAAFPWLKSRDDSPLVLLLIAAAVTFVWGYSIYFEARLHRGLDEVEKASAGYAAQWGPIVGQTVFVLLLLLPPSQTFMTAIVNKFAADPGTTVDRSVVVFAMTMGFMGVVLLQGAGATIMNVTWWMRRL